MASQKYRNRNIRKILKLGRGALAITVPVEFAKKLNWKEKQKVVVKKIHGGIQVKDWKK